LASDAAWPQALAFSLALGPHPQRELTPMRRRRRCLAVGAAWPQALAFADLRSSSMNPPTALRVMLLLHSRS